MDFKKIIGVSVVLSTFALVSGCNTVKGTVQGAGEDIRTVGQAVTPSHTVKKPVRTKKVYHKRTTRKNLDGSTTTTTNTSDSMTTTPDNQ